MQFTYRFLLAAVLLVYFQEVAAQDLRIYPSNWFVGMKWDTVQVLIQSNDTNFSASNVTTQYPGIKILRRHKMDNKKYICIDVYVSPKAKLGKAAFIIQNPQGKITLDWELKQRRKENGKSFAQGLNSGDFIYFLMPDRFSNGNPANDRIAGMRDQSLNRDSIFHRHGGDLEGVINHLDYLQDLGVTALWMTPVLENDMPDRSEHGYATTNHYNIEPRFGGVAAYKKLSDELHKRGMKLIQDVVYNHVGSLHHTFLDRPVNDWYHNWPQYTQTSYKDQPLFDTYATQSDKQKLVDGWFTPQMPDLNQSNPFVAHFLIQHALWSVEEFGVDAWRVDTYIYNDLDFMNRCNIALKRDFPHITSFGEAWVHGTAAQAYFAKNNFDLSFQSNVDGLVDFQMLFYGIQPTLMQPYGWIEGVNRLYMTLSNDFVYKKPFSNVVFLDNHDMTRFYTYIKEDFDKFKMGIGWLLTTRGIPQMYYGTEVLMTGEANPDGWVRLDFPGGWRGDSVNAFTQKGLSLKQKEAQNYTKLIANFRKNAPALQKGTYLHYQPTDGIYVYFRKSEQQTIMCIMNTTEKEMVINPKNYPEGIQQYLKAKNIVTQKSINISEKITLMPKTLTILELKH